MILPFAIGTCKQVTFDSTLGSGSSIVEKAEKGEAKNAENIYTVQCFPFYSILLAIGRTDVDYFGLDVEGAEYKVLETIPWDKVNIKVRYGFLFLFDLFIFNFIYLFILCVEIFLIYIRKRR